MIFNEKNGISLNLFFQRYQGVGGIMVSIAAFQAVDPGSIPGRRNYFYGVEIKGQLKSKWIYEVSIFQNSTENIVRILMFAIV
jgi:hypothetical protein